MKDRIARELQKRAGVSMALFEDNGFGFFEVGVERKTRHNDERINGLKVLIADNEKYTEKLIRDLLKKAPYELKKLGLYASTIVATGNTFSVKTIFNMKTSKDVDIDEIGQIWRGLV